MARQGDWNRTFWKSLNSIGKFPMNDIRQAMLEECGKTEGVLLSNTLVRYGGLLASAYAVVADTEDGISARAGYTQRLHWNLDVSNPHQDDFTNPQLMGYLYSHTKDGEKQIKLHTVAAELDNFPIRVMARVESILNGGK